MKKQQIESIKERKRQTGEKEGEGAPFLLLIISVPHWLLIDLSPERTQECMLSDNSGNGHQIGEKDSFQNQTFV